MFSEGTTEVWGGKLANDKYVVVLFNRGETKKSIDVNLRDELKLTFTSYSNRDPINHKDLGISTDNKISASVSPHSVVTYVLKLFNEKIFKILIGG